MAILTPYWSLDVAFVFLFAFLAFCVYMTRNFKYWAKKGVTEIPPIPLFGNFLDCCLFRISSSVHVALLYNQGKGLPYMGFYIFDTPALLLRDPEVIKAVVMRNSNCFIDRYVSTDESDTIGCTNIFLLKNRQWRGVRGKVSPFFTIGKMKNNMFPLMEVVGNRLVAHLDALGLQGDGQAIELKNICTRYTTDVITSCAFGLQVDSLNDPKSKFQRCGTKILGFSTYLRSAEFSAFFFTPKIVKLLKLKFFSKEASDFLRQMLMKTMAVRMETNSKRNDLVDLLIELKDSQNETDDPDELKLEGDSLVAQAAAFFAAGFETAASTMSFSLYELALHQDIQSKLREELIAAIAENGGEITFEMVMNLPYLDMVVSETLRKYPPLPFIDRVGSWDYKVPGTDLVIEKGTPVYISLLGLHYDPKYFPDPEKYDPERFNKENKHKIPPCVYMPFGAGPRNCLGLRFGLLQTKLGIVKFIQNYEVSASAQTPIPIRLDPRGFFLQTEGGMFLHTRRVAAD